MKSCKLTEKAQAGSKMGKTKPAGGGKMKMPKGDGLKTAWSPERGGRIELAAHKKKVR